MKQKAATLPPPPATSSVSLGLPTASTRGTPRNRCKLPAPQRHPSHPTLQRHLACLPPSLYEFPSVAASRGVTDMGWLSYLEKPLPVHAHRCLPGLTRRGVPVAVSIPALHSRLPPPENTLPGRPCRRVVAVGHAGRCSGTQGLLPRFSRSPSLLRLSLSCARSFQGSPAGRPRLQGSDSRGALCCACGASGTGAALRRCPLWETPRGGFEPLVGLADHPGVRQPPALTEPQHPASLLPCALASPIP